MTLRDLPGSKLLASLPDQLGSTSFLLVVATDPDRARAATDAWRLSAALATPSRRVCLVDLFLGDPLFDQNRGAPAGEGIVDAFLYGVSMQRVAVEQEVSGFYFIGAGAPVAYPEDVWGSARWRRLQRGFASEGALLVLLAPAAALPHLPVTPGRVIVLASTVSETPEIVFGWAREGIPVVRVLSEGEATRSPAEPSQAPASGKPQEVKVRPSALPPKTTWRQRRGPVGGWTIALGLGTVAVAALAAVELLRTTRGMAPPETTPATQTRSPTARPSGAISGDSLFYTIQIAAYTSPELAAEAAAAFQTAGWTATVSPVRLGRQGMWYRLMVGALPGPADAQQAMQRLWDEGLLGQSNGTVLHTPFAIELARVSTRAAAGVRLEGVRARGFVGYIVRAPDGSYRILVGAFETTEQAERADSILNSADFHGTIVRRAGFVQ